MKDINQELTPLMKNLNFKDKIVLVTGASGQLGKALCRAYAENGALVISADLALNDENLDSHENIEYILLDVTNYSSVQKVFEAISVKYGQIDVLINNAGVASFEPFAERSEENFDWVVNVNLKGTFNCIRALSSINMNQLNSSSIVNIGSIYGQVSPDFRIYGIGDRNSSEIYGATKAGVIQMTKYFAVNLANQNIRVNTVSPGGIYNPANPQSEKFIENYSQRCPLGRMARVEEITGAVLFLTSDLATYITGQNLTVDGGYSSW
jgi:NAD(P)-dependent dehydrogenase (short-subunit alcohol dehydrogenase family)